jgi:flavodoxin
MRALIVYASWLGHNRAIARMIGTKLARGGFEVTGAPAARVDAQSVGNYDLLVLGTYTHGGRASQRVRALCEAIPLRLFERVEVAVFGTQMIETQQRNLPGGPQELEASLAARGVELALPPLVVGLRRGTAFLPGLGIGAEERRRIAAFADELWEASVPEPMF